VGFAGVVVCGAGAGLSAGDPPGPDTVVSPNAMETTAIATIIAVNMVNPTLVRVFFLGVVI
jgi:hypothetical protein